MYYNVYTVDYGEKNKLTGLRLIRQILKLNIKTLVSLTGYKRRIVSVNGHHRKLS